MDSLSAGHKPAGLSGGEGGREASRLKVQRQGVVMLKRQVPSDGDQPAPFAVAKRPKDHWAADFDRSSKDAGLFATLKRRHEKGNAVQPAA